MKIAKPMLLITTPIGVLGGLYEGYRLAGGLVLLMFALLMMMGAAVGMMVLTVRREAAAEQRRKLSDMSGAATGTSVTAMRNPS
jgi:hypothetical protein